MLDTGFTVRGSRVQGSPFTISEFRLSGFLAALYCPWSMIERRKWEGRMQNRFTWGE